MSGAASSSAIHVAAFDDLTPAQLYGILQLRVQVFTVEQDCAYQDLDGQDQAAGTLQLWLEAAGGTIASTLRILERGDGRIIGRVATAEAFRGRGFSGQLIRHAIGLCAGHAIDISAQAHLQQWYEGFGFVRHGEEYLEDGIPHVAMRREADAADAADAAERA